MPNIYSSTKTGNGHWRSSSSSVLAELHGGDEYDGCRERRERSYSSEASSINSSSSSSGIVNGSALTSPGLAERWSTRRESKRRSTPIKSVRFASSITLHDSATAPTEVTPIAEARNVPSSESHDEIVVDRRALASQPSSSSSAAIVVDEADNRGVDERDLTNDTRDDADNNNTARTIENGNGAGERRTRANETDRACNDELVLTRDERDFSDEPVVVNGRGRASLTRSAIGFDDRDEGHSRAIGTSRTFDDELVKSVSSSSLSSGTASSADGSPISRPDRRGLDESKRAVPVRSELGETPGDRDERFGASDGTDNRSRDKLVGGRSSVAISGESRDDREADRDRAACARTKVTTNNDNTALLTNNNGHDREADALVVVETAKSIGDAATRTSSTTARRSLLWTSSNDFEARANERNEVDEPVGREVDDEAGTSGLEKVGDDSGEDEDRNANGTPSGLRNGVVGRPTGNRGDDPGKPSTSRRTGYGWNDPSADDIATNTAAASSSSSSSSSAGHSAPAAVHQNIYRGINEQIVSRPGR